MRHLVALAIYTQNSRLGPLRSCVAFFKIKIKTLDLGGGDYCRSNVGPPESGLGFSITPLDFSVDGHEVEVFGLF